MGKMRGSRKKLRKSPREKWKPGLFIKQLEPGDRVALKPGPSSHRGLYHPRFKGKIGQVIEKKGKSFVVKIKDNDKEKQLLTYPEHLKKV